MSVPTWLRSQSSAEYLWRLYKLNIRIAEICANKPKKYRANYGDALIKTGLQALQSAQMANDIYMSKTTPAELYMLRRKRLVTAKGLLANLSTTAYIFLELVKKSDQGAQCYDPDERQTAQVKADKIGHEEEEIGLACEEITRMISGVIKNDTVIYNKHIKRRQP